MILFDTDHFSLYVLGHPRVRERVLSVEDGIATTIITRIEVLQGRFASILKAADADRSISDVVNDAVRAALAEDAEDLAAFEQRAGEKAMSFESFVKSLRRRGRL